MPLPTLHLPVNDSFSIYDKRLRSNLTIHLSSASRSAKCFYRFRSVDRKFCKLSSQPSCMLYTPPTSPFLSYSCLYCKLIPGDRGGEIFRTRPNRPWGPPSLLQNGYRVSFPGGKAVGAWRWPPTPSRVEVKERVELYLYSPSGTSWPVVVWTLRLPLPLYCTLIWGPRWHSG